MMCNDVLEFVRRIDYDHERKILRVVVGYYGEIELTIFSDGKIRIDSCGMIMLDELLKTIECVKEIHKQLRAREHGLHQGLGGVHGEDMDEVRKEV